MNSTPALILRRVVGHAVALALVVFVSASCGAQTSNEPLIPEIAEASDEPQQAMLGITIPQSWKISLFAAEPHVANIVAFDIDPQGRLFVAESFRQDRGVTDNRAHDEKWLLADLAAETVQDRIDYHKRLLGDGAITYAQHDDRIRRAVDTDGDGQVDSSTVLANGFNRIEEGTGASVLVRGSDIYYTCIPKLWKLIDKDNDGQVDERIVLSDGYGVRVAFRGHDLHGLLIGHDGRLYFSIGDRGYKVTTVEGRVLADPASGAVFRCELDGSKLEVFATGLRNPQELAFNDVGDLFTVDNNSDSGDQARILHLLQGGDSGWRMHYQYLPDRGPYNRDRIWEPFHSEQPAYIVPPIANLTDGPSGLAYYPGSGFGEQLRDRFLICDFRGGSANSGIRSFKLDAAGAFYQLASDEPLIWNVLATDVAFGPDGGLYVSDWVDGWVGQGKGRVYRLHDPEHVDSALVRDVSKLLTLDWRKRRTDQLIRDLEHADRRVRLEAQWELARRGETSGLVSIAKNTEKAHITRLHALWGLDQILRSSDATNDMVLDELRPLLKDENEYVRAASAKLAGELGDQAALTSLIAMTSDSSARVVYFATLALSRLASAIPAEPKHPALDQCFDAVVKTIESHSRLDPALRHAGVIFLAGCGQPSRVEGLADHPNAVVRRSAVVALRRLRSGSVSKFMKDPDTLVVGEAVRAIHDEPILISLEKLAKLPTESVSDPVVIQRVLNANFRIGTDESVAAIAAYAAQIAAPDEFRIEALDMLGSWGTPGVLDRVTHQFRPLDSRAMKSAAEALQPRINDLLKSSEAVREKAIQVASKLGLKSIAPQLAKRVADATQSHTGRANALTALAALEPPLALELARGIPLTPTTPLVPAALEVIARGDRVALVETFVEATKLRDTTSRQLGWDILRGIESPIASSAIEQGVKDYMDETLPEDVRLNVREAAVGRISEETAKRLAAYDAKVADADPLAAWLDAKEGGKVDAGKKLFFEKTELSCVRCHKIDRAGGEVGPNLTVIGKEKDSRYLLEALCLPSASIAKGFETAIIATEDGDVINGIVRSETDVYVELLLADGSQKRIDQLNIAARKSGNSSMPADLHQLISLRELRDLVAYLGSLKVDPQGARDAAGEAE